MPWDNLNKGTHNTCICVKIDSDILFNISIATSFATLMLYLFIFGLPFSF